MYKLQITHSNGTTGYIRKNGRNPIWSATEVRTWKTEAGALRFAKSHGYTEMYLPRAVKI